MESPTPEEYGRKHIYAATKPQQHMPPSAHLANSPASFLACSYCSLTASPVETHSPRPPPVPPTPTTPCLVVLLLLLLLWLLLLPPSMTLRLIAPPGAPSLSLLADVADGGGGGDEPTTSANDMGLPLSTARAGSPPAVDGVAHA